MSMQNNSMFSFSWSILNVCVNVVLIDFYLDFLCPFYGQFLFITLMLCECKWPNTGLIAWEVDKICKEENVWYIIKVVVFGYIACNGTKVVVVVLKEDDGGKWMIVVERHIVSSSHLKKTTSSCVCLLCVFRRRLVERAAREMRKWTDLPERICKFCLKNKLGLCKLYILSLIHIWRCRRIERCRSRWSPYN